MGSIRARPGWGPRGTADGGVSAAGFRDPDNLQLELIHFPG
jgi:hypothetical protein